VVGLNQGRGICGPREHLIGPTSEVLLAKSEYNIAPKRSSMISRFLVNQDKSLFLIVIDEIEF